MIVGDTDNEINLSNDNVPFGLLLQILCCFNMLHITVLIFPGYIQTYDLLLYLLWSLQQSLKTLKKHFLNQSSL